MPHCPHCGEIVGVYEPVIVLIDGDARTTSLAREPVLADEPQLPHKQCTRRRPLSAPQTVTRQAG